MGPIFVEKKALEVSPISQKLKKKMSNHPFLKVEKPLEVGLNLQKSWKNSKISHF